MKNLQKLVLTALFAAFTCIATMILKIPTPTFGYIHIGDCFVLLSGIILGPGAGALSAGIGSAAADLFGGYVIWAPATFVIKALTAALAGILFRAGIRKFTLRFRNTISLILGGILGEAVMVFGYFIFEVALAAFAAGSLTSEAVYAGILSSATGIPFNLVQGGTGILLSALLLPVLSKIPLLRPMLGKEKAPSHS